MFKRLAACLSLALLCTSCITENAVEVEQASNQPKKTALEAAHERVARRVEQVRYQSGKDLLGTLQELVNYKELALGPIAEAMPTADARTKAHLIYVLGFLRSPEAHNMLVSSLRDKSEVVRYEAAAGLLSQGDMSAVPVLIGFMDSEDRRMRYKAFSSLTEATGEDFGYDFNSDPMNREEAIGRWENWWHGRRREIILGEG